MGMLKSVRKSFRKKETKEVTKTVEVIEDADTVGGSEESPVQEPTNFVTLPTGKLGIKFKGRPPVVTHVAQDSPLAGELKVGQVITGVSTQGKKGMYDVMRSKDLSQYLKDNIDANERMLITKGAGISVEEKEAPVEEEPQPSMEEQAGSWDQPEDTIENSRSAEDVAVVQEPAVTTVAEEEVLEQKAQEDIGYPCCGFNL